MDENLGTKVPVTRSRRRLSVEVEEANSPAPSTPTKKRGTRLAAKTQLELINEVAENVPKRTTRKAAAKEVVESEDAPVTPSRRSTRIRSNASILSETTQGIESPRTKRALRRNSALGFPVSQMAWTNTRHTQDPRTNFMLTTQSVPPAPIPSFRKQGYYQLSHGVSKFNDILGSDTESTVTPARQTRRTRKDSTPSIDKPAGSDNIVVHAVTSTNAEPINEESELGSITSNQDSNTNISGNIEENPSTRRSPRLQNKITDINTDNDKNDNKSTENTVKQSPSANKSQQASQITKHSMDTEKKINNPSPFKLDEKLDKPDTDVNFRKNAVDVNFLNKTTPSIRIAKRTRTKSWTTLTTNGDNAYAQEMSKCETPNKNMSGSGDGMLINDDNRNIIEAEVKSPNKSMNKTKTQLNISIGNKENLVINSKTEFEINKCDTAELFQNCPNEMESILLINDSDSGSGGKPSIDIQMDVDDQCVPIVINQGTNDSPKKTTESSEPMDIDESMPRNVTIDVYSDTSNSSKEETNVCDKRNSLICGDNNISGDKVINKSERKSTSLLQDKSKRDSIIQKQNNELISLLNNSIKNSSKMDSSHKGKPNDTLNKSNGSSKNESITASNSSRKSSKSHSYQQADSDDAMDKSNRVSSLSIHVANDSECAVHNEMKSIDSIGDQSIKKLKENSNKSKRKSSTSDINSEIIKHVEEMETSNNSKKSNLSTSISQNLEKTANENKSTLVISQLKDVSCNDSKHVMSPNVTNNEHSKSLNQVSVQIKEMNKKNSSLNYLTSTPIQQKPPQKLTMQINTSIISPNEEIEKHESTPKKILSKLSSNSNNSNEQKNEINVIKMNQSGVNPNKKSPNSITSDSEKFKGEQLSDSENIKLEIKSVNKQESSDSSDSSDDESKPTSTPINTNIPNKNGVNESKKKLTTQTWTISDDSQEEITEDKSKIINDEASDAGEGYESGDSQDDEITADKSKIINDEASDAGEGYESGDSQDDEDRKYAEENEIVEKGKSLDSEDDFSDESEYEKDSFIVSSDAEDEEMLSGTGDDLSLTDNELTISAKSKKKFNKRKQKEQKIASREMYEARHKIDKSQNSKKQRMESENEKTEPRKKNRLRIDSSPDISGANSDADESIKIKKKKMKRLSESVCENTINEKEITICNQSISDKNDPLTVSIKQEPKTPMRKFEISTVAITEGMEEVIVNDASIVEQNDTLDPLQATIAADEDSSSSDNEEIIQNYDSVLNNLNLQSMKIKTIDTSLNLNKKSKCKNAKQPVIDELNLTVTQGKKSKKLKNKSDEEAKPVESATPQSKDSKLQPKDDSDESDSIDMKLLFPEDSNDSQIPASQFKPEINDAFEEFIPLRRTEAKTNIPGKIDLSVSLNDSASKKNKTRKSYPCTPDEVPNDEGDFGIKIIMDTTGTHEALDETMTQSSSTKKKKKDKNKSVTIEESTEHNIATALEVDCTDGVAENVLEIFKSEKKRKKNKKDKSFDLSSNNIENSISQIENADDPAVEEMPANISIKSDKKKNKTDVSANNISMDDEPIVATQTLSAKKKPKKISMSAEDVEPQSENTELKEVPADTSIKSEKKKKKNKRNKEVSQSMVDNAGEESDEAPLEVSYRSEKKGDEADTVLNNEEPASSGKKNKKKNKKKKKDKELSQSFENSGDIKLPSTEQDIGDSKKRKRTASGNALIGTQDAANDVPVEYVPISNEKKKRKIHLDVECIQSYNETNELHESENSAKKSKKKKKSKNHDNVDEQDEVLHQNPKKRKNREDDNLELISKVPKQHSFDSILIPRLPESILSQLDDKPKNKASKMNPAVISTVPFVVEETRRRKNKPSNYLEQSVYLNDDDDQPPETKKRKRSKHKPKVLPFMPTALTSDSGYTSNFNINVVPRETQFVAQASNTENFKQNYLDSQRIKKFKTLQHCKSIRSHKLTKF